MPTPRRRTPERLALLLAVMAGLLVFADYFFPGALFKGLAQFLLRTTVLLAGGALVLASFALAWRHASRAKRKQIESMLLVGAFVVMFLAGLLPGGFLVGLGGWLYHWVLAPGMAALFALLPIFLAFALLRHLHLRDFGGFLFFLGMIIVLVGQIPAMAARIPLLAGLRHDLLIGPAAAAFRGVLLGIGIGVILAALLRLFRSILPPRRPSRLQANQHPHRSTPRS